jgi:hypothetical protein
VKLQAPGGCRGVDTLGEGHKCHTHGLELVQEQDQVAQVPPESIQAPAHEHIERAALGIAHQHIERAALGIAHQRIERGALVLRPAHAPVHVLDGGPAPRRAIAPQFLELVLGLLVVESSLLSWESSTAVWHW